MEEKQLTSRELEEQANALLAEADFEEINLPKKAKKAAAAKKANEDTAQAEKPAEKYPPLDEKLVASLPAAALLQGSEKLMEIFAKGKAKGKLSSSDLMETIDEMNLESEQLDQIYDSLETLGVDIAKPFEMIIAGNDKRILFRTASTQLHSLTIYIQYSG